MFQVECRIISLRIRFRSIERDLINQRVKWLKRNAAEDVCFTQAEADSLVNWLSQHPNHFDIPSIVIIDCDLRYIPEINQPGQLAPPIILLRSNTELSRQFNLPFEVIGYPI